jgi:hypothetical protein
MVRAKFKCVEKGEAGSTTTDKHTKVILQAVTTGSEENKTFWRWTPSGRLEMSVLNTQAGTLFEVGKEYYVDFTPAE